MIYDISPSKTDSGRQGVGSPALDRFERPPALASPTGAVNQEV